MRIHGVGTSGDRPQGPARLMNPLRLRTSTRGFDTTVELQQAMSRPFPRKASAEEAAWQQARVVRSRLGHNGEVAATRRAAARVGCLRVMAASPCDSTLQQHDELNRHTSECHGTLPEKIRSCSRSPRSLPSKIHAATPPQNLAAVESLLRATRAPSSSSMALLSEKKSGAKTAF